MNRNMDNSLPLEVGRHTCNYIQCKMRKAIETDGKCQKEPISSASVEEGKSESNFLEVQAFERGIENEKLKGSRGF